MNKNDVKWEGIFPVPVIPFDEEGNIKEQALINFIGGLVKDGAHGIIINGHNSESWATTREEKKHLCKLVVDSFSKKVPIIAGVEGVTPKEVIEGCNDAKEAGAEGVMITPPHYLATATDKEVIKRYEIISSEIDLPIMLYNNPRRTQISLYPELLERLADIEKVVALKEAVSDIKELTTVIDKIGNKIGVFCDSIVMLPGVLLGCQGTIFTGPMEFLGKDFVDYWENLKQGNVNEKVINIHKKIIKIGKLCIPGSYGTHPATFKAALNILGKEVGVPRLPVLPVEEKYLPKLREDLKEIGLLV
jgi:4-hydroxy-tetrahydrodipicolinate synthase